MRAKSLSAIQEIQTASACGCPHLYKRKNVVLHLHAPQEKRVEHVGTAKRPTPARRSALTTLVASLLMVLTATFLGCSTPSWLRGEGFDGPNAELGKGIRSTSKNAPNGTGIDARARQIEANLGLKVD